MPGAGYTRERIMTLQQLPKTYDPDQLTYALARLFSSRPPTGFIVGRTLVRDTVTELLDCSQREADEIVDTLILRGRLVFVRPPEELGTWAFRLAHQC
jgi:hypothetical protein